MRIWLVQVGEELPMDGSATRLLRTALLARALAERGHEIVYWNAAFNHQRKHMRNVGGPVRQEGLFDAILLPGRAYAKNVSIARILSQRENADGFARMAQAQPKPDIILCGFPTIELAAAVRDYALRHSIPYVIDARDMWPEVIEEHLPASLRALAWPQVALWRRMRRQALHDATAITGITDAFVDWALACAGRARSASDVSFHLAISPTQLHPAKIIEATRYWEGVLGPIDRQRFTIVFAGTISERMDFDTCITAVARLPDQLQDRLQLVICGEGDARARLVDRALNLSAIHFPGWKDAAQLRALMERADAGLLPYPNTPDFRASYPNKVGEYLSCGLPIITGLGGITEARLTSHDVLLPYTNGDAASLTCSLAQWLAAPELVRARAKAARQLFEAEFDPTHIYPAYAQWVERIASQKVTAQ